MLYCVKKYVLFTLKEMKSVKRFVLLSIATYVYIIKQYYDKLPRCNL